MGCPRLDRPEACRPCRARHSSPASQRRRHRGNADHRDGEVAIYDQKLRSRFDWLREPEPDAVATPPLFMAFDLLYHERRDLTARPLRDRRARLEDIVANNDLIFPVRRLAPDGLEAWKQVIARGYEGYVAKDEARVCEGRATRRRLEVKEKDWTVGEDGGAATDLCAAVSGR